MIGPLLNYPVYALVVPMSGCFLQWVVTICILSLEQIVDLTAVDSSFVEFIKSFFGHVIFVAECDEFDLDLAFQMSLTFETGIPLLHILMI